MTYVEAQVPAEGDDSEPALLRVTSIEPVGGTVEDNEIEVEFTVENRGGSIGTRTFDWFVDSNRDNGQLQYTVEPGESVSKRDVLNVPSDGNFTISMGTFQRDFTYNSDGGSSDDGDEPDEDQSTSPNYRNVAIGLAGVTAIAALTRNKDNA